MSIKCHKCGTDASVHVSFLNAFAPVCETCLRTPDEPKPSGCRLKTIEEIENEMFPPAYVTRNKGDLKCKTCGIDLDEGVYLMPKCYACRMKDNEDNAIKYDTDKAQFHLIPVEPLVELGNLYLFGAQKYEADNWKKGMAYSRVFNALLRHLYAWWYEREPSDKETKLHHLASVAWCAFTLMWYDFKEVGEDDRPGVS